MIKVWDLGRRKLQLPRRPLVMGILNVTPDSFSDGGQHIDPKRAVEVALQMEADGADIIDIGGESTRPYSDPVGVQQELDRVMPVIERLAGKLSIPISIDTSKSAGCSRSDRRGRRNHQRRDGPGRRPRNGDHRSRPCRRSLRDAHAGQSANDAR